MPNLDPDPTNELGHGVLDPDTEARLIALGYIYAHRVTTKRGRTFVGAYKRSLAETLRSEAQDAYKALRSARNKQSIAAG